MVKDISAIVVAVIVGLLVSVIGMMVYNTLYPYPSDLNTADKVSMTGFLDDLPNKAYAIKIFVNIVAAFSAVFLATLISNSKKLFGIIGLMVFVAIIIYRDSKYDYPDLYFIVGMILTTISGLFGLYLGTRRIG
jgi:hypothetical protein